MKKRAKLYGRSAFKPRLNTKHGLLVTSALPIFPARPSRTYAKTGWPGWGDYLGVHNRWSKTSLLAFVSSIAPMLNRLQPSEIYAILRQNGCLNAVDSLAETSPLKRLVHAAFHQDKKAIEQSIRDLGLEKSDDAEIAPSSDVPENDVITGTIVPNSKQLSNWRNQELSCTANLLTRSSQ
jgi:hypothetical protein